MDMHLWLNLTQNSKRGSSLGSHDRPNMSTIIPLYYSWDMDIAFTILKMYGRKCSLCIHTLNQFALSTFFVVWIRNSLKNKKEYRSISMAIACLDSITTPALYMLSTNQHKHSWIKHTTKFLWVNVSIWDLVALVKVHTREVFNV